MLTMKKEIVENSRAHHVENVLENLILTELKVKKSKTKQQYVNCCPMLVMARDVNLFPFLSLAFPSSCSVSFISAHDVFVRCTVGQ